MSEVQGCRGSSNPRGSRQLRDLDAGATLDDLREAMTTLEETGRTARRVFGGAHPLTTAMEDNLRQARAAFRARETGRTASSIDNKIRVI